MLESDSKAASGMEMNVPSSNEGETCILARTSSAASKFSFVEEAKACSRVSSIAAIALSSCDSADEAFCSAGVIRESSVCSSSTASASF